MQIERQRAHARKVATPICCVRINTVAEFTEMAGRDGRGELLIGPAPNCLSLAYRGLTDISRELASGLASVGSSGFEPQRHLVS